MTRRRKKHNTVLDILRLTVFNCLRQGLFATVLLPVESNCFLVNFADTALFLGFSKLCVRGQLWGVLALLATAEKDDPGISVGASLGVRERLSRLSTFWEVPYVEVLQLSISSFQDIFNLQCRFDTWICRQRCGCGKSCSNFL